MIKKNFANALCDCSGFSLLELMIVLTIIAILAAIAIPNYQLYVKKAKFSEIITQVTPYKTSVEMCAQLLGALGADDKNCGTPGQNEIPPNFSSGANDKTYLASIVTAYQSPNVTITATSKGLGEAYTYILKATATDSGELNWDVDSASTCLAAGLCHE